MNNKEEIHYPEGILLRKKLQSKKLGTFFPGREKKPLGEKVNSFLK